MARSIAILCIVTAAGLSILVPAPACAQDASLAGVWTLNRSLSEFPREIGFNPGWLSASSAGGQTTRSGTGGGGRRGAAGGGNRESGSPFSARPESSEDARRAHLLVAEVRDPAVRLMIVDTPAAFTITNELGQSRTLHPNGKEESIDLEGVPLTVTTRHDGDRLLIEYRVDQDRAVRYTYSRSTDRSQLIVDVQLFQHGEGDKARRVYEPGVATPAVGADAGSVKPAPAGPQTGDTFDQRPGAELKGLKTLGILVEDLSPQAIACGLNHDTIENALSQRLTDGGFSVRKNSDDDTYLYINVLTTTVSTGLCVSRYDAFLYTHATARLSYHDQPVLVQISLAHRGGIGSSAPAAHGAAVTHGLENYVDLFITQVRDSNK